MGDRASEGVAYLPASLLRSLAARPSATLPWCHEVDGTMVMADLSGFTALSERLAKLGDEGAERLTSVINSFFEKMLKTASRYGGDALTFGGDAILLLFDGEEHPARAVAASLEMLKQVDRTAAVEGGDGKVKIGMSVGAHSDTFVLGAAGLADERAHLFVLGRGAEMTALAEAQAERGQLAVSTSTKRLLLGRVKTARAGDFWRVNQLTGEDHRHGAWAGMPASKPSLATGRSLVPEYDPRLFAPFLPPYARSRGEGGGGRVQHEPEHRRTVIAFVNILGLKDVIANAGVQAALEQLQSYSAMLTRLAGRHHGFVVSSDIATEGSKLVITFGAPVAHEYAPANAARFALDLTDELRASALDLQHKIGLNGGHVFAGEVGPPFRRQYTVMGDAVNLAARLMSAAAPGEALISRNLLDYVSPDLCARDLEPISVKGKEQPVGVCVLEREQRTGRQLRGGGGGRSSGSGVSGGKGDSEAGPRQGPLFGRRAELALIRKRWEQARSGRGCTVLVEGEPGVGKTRLLQEALRAMTGPGADAPPARVTRAACFEHLQAAPFTPWIDVLQSILELTRDDLRERRTEIVQAFLEGHLADLAEFGALLNPLLDLSLPQSEVVGSLDAQTRRAKLFELVGSILAESAADGGRVVVLEDLHWVDESSQALVAHLAHRLTGDPILLLLTTRPTDARADLAGAEVTRVVLAELSRSESLAMVREALGVADLPDAVGEALYAKTKGNPLFLEEVVHSLQAPGVLERILSASSVTRAAELAALEIPDRVQGLLMSRIDRLAADAREVLKAGSVVGRSFDEKVLSGIDDSLLRPASLDRAFDELVGAALVVRGEDADGSSLTFRHALVQDVAYDSLPFARRRDLHGRVARYLDAIQSPPDHAVLVHHYQHAGDTEKTRLHAVRASESSVAVYANREAIDYLSLALGTARARTARDACLRSRFEELMGDSFVTLARHDEAVASFSRARRRWASPAARRVSEQALRGIAPIDDPDARDSLLCWKIAVAIERGRSAYRRALRWLESGTAALPPGSKDLAARMLVAKCGFLARMGRYHEALGFGEEGLALAREDGEVALQAYAWTLLGHAVFGLGLLERAIECDTKAIALYEQAGDLLGLGMGHLNLADCYQFTGDLHAALEHNELSLGFVSRIGHTNLVATQHGNLGEVLLVLGETDEALKHLEEAVRPRAEQGVNPMVTGIALVLLCRARVWVGDLDAAQRALDEGRGILESIDAQGLLLDADIVDAELRLAQGNLEQAETSCGRALSQARSMGAEVSEAEALCVGGQIQLAMGDAEAAIPGLEACVALAEKSGLDHERARALALLAEARASYGGGDEAACEDDLAEAIRLFRQMGARYDLEKALAVRERLQVRT